MSAGRRRCLTCWRKPRLMFCDACTRSYLRATNKAVVLHTDVVAWAVRRAFAMQTKWLAMQEAPDYGTPKTRQEHAEDEAWRRAHKCL